MFDIKEYAEKVNYIRRNGKSITNNYLSVAEIAQISLRDNSLLVYNEEALAIIYDDNHVNRVCFHISSFERTIELNRLLKECKIQPLVAECVGKNETVETLSEALEQIGFSIYARMSRWQSKSIKHLADLDRYKCDFAAADEKQIIAIINLFKECFDPIISHLPSEDRLKSLIEAGLVYTLVEKEKVQAVSCLERIGKKGLYLYQFAVAEKCRGHQVGSAIYQYTLERFAECNNYISWTSDGNKASNHIHDKFGFRRDGLKSIILIYKSEGQ